MEYNKSFFEKVFSNKRMERYFRLYDVDKMTSEDGKKHKEMAKTSAIQTE